MIEGKPLRPYQSGAILDLRKALSKLDKSERRAVLAMGTGSGKTRTIAELIRLAFHKGKKILFVADRLVLVKQAVDVLDEMLPIKVGVLQSRHERMDPSKQVQVCSTATLSSWVKQGKCDNWRVDLIIHDEGDVTYAVRDQLSEKFPEAVVIALTATPTAKGMGSYYKDIVQPVSVPELIEQGFLSPVKVYSPSYPDMKGVKSKGDWTDKQAAAAFTDALVGDAVEHWHRLAYGKPTMMFCATVEHSKLMVEAFVKAGVAACHIDGYTTEEGAEENAAILEKYRTGEYTMISCAALLARGYDAPWTEAIIMARVTKSLALWLQICGRVMRPSPETGKTFGIIIDHAGGALRHGLPSDHIEFELDSGEKKEKSSDTRKDGEKLPVPCANCGVQKPNGARKCFSCNFEPAGYSTVVNIDGELVEITSESKMTDAQLAERAKVIRENKKEAKKKDWSKSPMEEKQQWYGELLQMARDRKKTNGWLAGMYKSRFDVWPRMMDGIKPRPVSPEVAKYVQHRNIAYAKSNRHKAA